jgi:hypothetical protein
MDDLIWMVGNVEQCSDFDKHYQNQNSVHDVHERRIIRILSHLPTVTALSTAELEICSAHARSAAVTAQQMGYSIRPTMGER